MHNRQRSSQRVMVWMVLTACERFHADTAQMRFNGGVEFCLLHLGRLPRSVKVTWLNLGAGCLYYHSLCSLPVADSCEVPSFMRCEARNAVTSSDKNCHALGIM